MVTLINYKRWIPTEMSPVKALFLSMFMLSGILMWGAGIYAADAAGDLPAVDGYGVTASVD
ncbi:hypothetical protein [Mesorhizobium sp. CAU 1741]|uniref:hypothetical protein n=1 Tax=Mesorhizobium sp. CAU 1741 TaxID=3140366 RepID=UPI00325BD5C6